MEFGTPALVFLATTLAVGGACLGFLKRRYHTTHHHWLVLALVGAIAYLAPLHITRSADAVAERLMLTWMGLARVHAHALERAVPATGALTLETLKPVVEKMQLRLGHEASVLRTLSIATSGEKGKPTIQSMGLQHHEDRPTMKAACDEKLQRCFTGKEFWCMDVSKSGEAASLMAMIPLLDEQQAVKGVMILEFFPQVYNKTRFMEQWRVVGEFTGLLIICVCLGGFLVVKGEKRRQQELEKAIQPLLQDIESLDGMVNSIQGVVWERPAAGGGFTYLSQSAEGYLGYDMDRWGNENGFLLEVIHSEDRNRVQETWTQAAADSKRYQMEYRVVRADGSTAFVQEYGQAAKLMLNGLVLRGILLDITTQRENEASTQDTHKIMVEASRQAGMAEIATGVLHNVGNVLNSLNVGAKLLADRLKKSRMDKLCQATQLLKENLPDNPTFFTDDKRGQVLPGYLVDLSSYLRDEQNRLNATVSDMIERIEHIRDMIMLQQSHSSVRTLWEPLDLVTVMEEALRLEMDVNIAHQQVKIVRHFADLPPIYSARGLLLQILVNLLANACQAMGDKPVAERKMSLRIQPQGETHVRIVVEDTGCGIQPRHLTSIFTQGFTTKKDGHGFGLHHACLLAQDLGGSLKAESEGLGKGARFILEIPARKDSKATSPLANSVSASTYREPSHEPTPP